MPSSFTAGSPDPHAASERRCSHACTRARGSAFLLLALLVGSAAQSAPAPRSASGVITVQRGDTLFRIALRHRTTVQRLMHLNNLSGSTIRAGQPLRVGPAPTSGAATKPAATKQQTVYRTVARYVTVRKGETLHAVAVRAKTTSRRIVQLNKLRSKNLHVGQKLAVGTTTVASRVTVPVGPKAPSGEAVRYIHGRVLGVPVSAVRIDLRNPRVLVTPILPVSGLGTGGVFTRMARTTGATAVVNGGYFHPTSFIPAGDLVVHGRYVFSGKISTAVAITPDNRVRVRSVTKNAPATWAGFESVIASGPHILQRGRVVVSPFTGGFRDPAIFRRAMRTVLGTRGDRTLILMSTGALLSPSEAAKVMRQLGASDAILLDGGSSTGFAWKGRVLIKPARRISYGIAVYAHYLGRRYAH